MPKVDIPINLGANLAYDEVGLDTHGAALLDGYTNAIGQVNRRPGKELLVDLGTGAGIDGLYLWDQQRQVIAVSNGRTFRITSKNGVNAEISGVTLKKGIRVSFAAGAKSGDNAVYYANGGKIAKIGTSGTSAFLTDADAPTTVTHLAITQKYLLANTKDTQYYDFSDTPLFDSFSGNIVSAEAKEDNLLAMGVSNTELFLCCQKSFEVHRNDGVTPWAKELQGVIDRGTVAPYSFIFLDNWWWLDDNGQVVKLIGRTPTPVSDTLNTYLNESFEIIEDAVADKLVMDGQLYYILAFPSENKTICVNSKTGAWSEWSYWNALTAERERWIGNTILHIPIWGLTLVGDRRSGKIYKLSKSYGDDAGDKINTVLRTWSIDHGDVQKKKKCRRVDFFLKRNKGFSTVSTPKLYVKYRNDGSTEWKKEKIVTLKQSGRTSFKGYLTALGSYQDRQWEVKIVDTAPIALTKMQETYF